jgi:plastocyanin domain-containing protein
MTGIEWGVALSAVAAVTWVNWYFFVAGRSPALAMAVGASTGDGAIPEIVITVDGGYSPNTVRVKVGQPVRLVFDRKDDSSCSEEVVIADFGIRRFLPTGERTTIEITPPAAGSYSFTCGMSMLRGTVVADG